MFSQKIYAEIALVTRKALDEMHNTTTINQVTVILGYVQLSSRNVPGYDAELRTAIDRLLELARAENQQVLADALDALGQHMADETQRIIAELSHDLRQPLTSLHMNLQSAMKLLQQPGARVSPGQFNGLGEHALGIGGKVGHRGIRRQGSGANWHGPVEKPWRPILRALACRRCAHADPRPVVGAGQSDAGVRGALRGVRVRRSCANACKRR